MEREKDWVLVSVLSSHLYNWQLGEDGSARPCPRVNLDHLIKTERVYKNVQLASNIYLVVSEGLVFSPHLLSINM